MKAKTYMIAVVLIATFAIGVSAYAQGPGGGSGDGSMMGGGGRGMMGGHGGGMMGYGQGISALWEALSKKLGKGNQNNYNEKETETLRRQIWEKRRELSSLYRSNKSDKKLIDQKINELNRLESELDEKMSASGHER